MRSRTPGFEVVTFATHHGDPSGQGNLKVLEDSCRSCGLKLSVLGLGRRWTGFSLRLLLYADFLAAFPDDAIVLFVDAFDVVLLPNAGDLAVRFRTFNAPVVFSAEFGCWPHPELAPLYPPAPVVKPPARAPEHSLRPPPPVTTPFRYLNAGSFIGYAGAIRRLIQALSPRETDDDQALFTRHFLQNPGSMKLDYGATLFQTLCGLAANDLVIEKGKPLTLRNRLLGTEPCLLHGNGPGRTVFFALLACMRALGWP